MSLTTKSRAHRAILAVTAAALAAVLGAGCGGGGGAGKAQTAPEFIRQVTMQFARGQSGPLWDTLHPADQAVVSRARYMACESNEGFDLTKIRILQTYPDTVDVAGHSTPSTAVSIRATADDGITTATMHAVKVNGAWRWILSPSDSAAYSKGRCPSS